jgi:flagellar biogenesis protein FliO
MQIQETLNLTPKRSLHIVRIGDQTLLIGATDQGINLLSEISPEPSSTQFQTLLQNAVAENSVELDQ